MRRRSNPARPSIPVLACLGLCGLLAVITNSAADVPGGTNIDFASKALVGPTFVVAYNPTTQHLYVGSQRVVSVYNAINPASLSLLGRVAIPPSTYDGAIFSMDYPGGDHVIVSVRSDGLYSIDVTDPTSPLIADSLAVGGSYMDIDGTVAFIAVSPRTVTLVDVSDPENLALTGSWTKPGGEGLNGPLVAANGHAYMMAQDGLFAPVGVWVIDGTNPSAPTQVNNLLSGWGDVHGIGGDDSRLYLASGGLRLEILDLSTPASPTLLGSDTPVISGLGSIFPDGTTGYAPVGDTLAIIDTSDPNDHVLLGSTSDFPSYGVAGDVALGPAGFIFMAAGDGGFQVVDVSPASTPSVAGSYPTPGEISEVTVSGAIAYYLSTGIGIFAVDNTNVDRSEIVSVIETSASTVHADGDRLYYADSAFRVSDITDPTSPTELGNLTVSGGILAIDTAAGRAYLAKGLSGLSIVDVSDPAAMSEVGSAPASDVAVDVKVLGSHAYVANRSDGLAIYDVTNPASPALVGSLDTPDSAVALDVVGRYAYVATEFSGLLQIIDVLDPTNPILVGQYTTPGAGFAGRPLDVVVAGDLAYIASNGDGLRVVDVFSPVAPVEVASYVTEDNFLAVAYQLGYATTGERDGGASIVHYVGGCFDPFEPNDDFASAFPISDAAVYSPKICDQNDLDHFSIVPVPGDTLDITMQPPPGRDYNLFLYDAQETLIDASVTSGDSAENIVQLVPDAGPYTVQVAGAAGQFDSSLFYTLFYFRQACEPPAQEVYVYTSDFDENSNVVLFVQDPNQAGTVTGYNLYRAPHPIGPYDLIGENLDDFDQGEPNIQLVDVDSASCGSLCYYKVTAVNGTCGAEGPGAPEPLDLCPSVTPCNGESCVSSGPSIGSSDTGLTACLDSPGSALICGNQTTVHVATYGCVDAPCCFTVPACPCFIGGCADGTYLECQ